MKRSAAAACTLACLLGGFVAVSLASAQDSSPASLEDEAARAVQAGDYGGAAGILRRARTLWPEDPRMPLLLGDLYTDRGLHSLAVDEYLAAESLDPENPETLQRIADGYGFLNRPEDSIRYLRRILAGDAADMRAAGDLGWMLFKTHRLREGIALIEDAELRIGRDIGFSMTLGTPRAELFEYEEARRRYEEAISGSRAEGYRRFAAVAYYNLSLLESRFRHWDTALETADQSIREEARSSGFLARGELRLRRMELGLALEDFTNAFAVDTTPLARLSLAEVSRIAGRLDEALAWVREVAALEEHPWMASFGTDPESFAMDLHELLWEIYRGRAEREKARPKKDFRDAALSWIRRISDRLQAFYHERLFEKAARAVAAAYAREGAALPAAAHGVSAFRPYPALAKKYLEEARRLETVHVPESAPSYELEAALLRRDVRGLSAALGALDPVWERDLEEEGLGGLAGLLLRRGRRSEARPVLERLWLLNPGALPQRGLCVPALFRLEPSPGTPVYFLRGLARRLGKMGLVPEGRGDAGYAFILNLRMEGGKAEYALVQRSSGLVLKKGSYAFGDAAPSGAELADFLFRSLHEPNL